MKFIAQKLAAKVSNKCQLRCKDYDKTISKLHGSGPEKDCIPVCNRVVADERDTEDVSNS